MGVLSPRNLPHRLRWGLARGLGVLVKGKVVRWPGGPEWDTGWTRRARAHIIATGSERRLRAADDTPHHHCMCCDFLVLLLAFALATRLSGCLHHQPCGMAVQQEVVRAVLWLGSTHWPLCCVLHLARTRRCL